MTRDLLWRGMLAGVLAALCATIFARFFAEPSVDLAIAFEAAHAAAGDHDPELVSRAVQKGLGLLTAVTLYGSAMGGLFALVFALAYGRLVRIGPRSLALIMALTAFVVLGLVPALKYPASPPSVGRPETIQLRTVAYFLMLGLSVAALAAALALRSRFNRRFGALDASLAAGAAYVAVVAIVQLALPTINEIPKDFPATLLWNFRVASLATQAVLWTGIGLAFGTMAERLFRRTGHT